MPVMLNCINHHDQISFLLGFNRRCSLFFYTFVYFFWVVIQHIWNFGKKFVWINFCTYSMGYLFRKDRFLGDRMSCRKSRHLNKKLRPSLTWCIFSNLKWLYFCTGFKRFSKRVHFFKLAVYLLIVRRWLNQRTC